jgi:hypothetical protein
MWNFIICSLNHYTNEDKVDKGMNMHIKQMTSAQHAEFQHETLKERDHFGDLDVDGRIILKWIVFHVFLCGSLVTAARRVLWLRMEQTSSRYGG